MLDRTRQTRVVVDVNACSRCGLNHKGLVFTLAQEPIVEIDGKSWPYWASCPSTGDPVLMRIDNVSGVERVTDK